MAISKRAMDERLARQMGVLHRILEDHEIDDRLSPGQLHALATDALGCEPIAFACNLLAMAMDARSKIQIAPAESARLALQVMDRLYGPPDVKMRKKDESENQFQLEFAWATGTDTVTVTADGELSDADADGDS